MRLFEASQDAQSRSAQLEADLFQEKKAVEKITTERDALASAQAQSANFVKRLTADLDRADKKSAEALALHRDAVCELGVRLREATRKHGISLLPASSLQGALLLGLGDVSCVLSTWRCALASEATGTKLAGDITLVRDAVDALWDEAWSMIGTDGHGAEAAVAKLHRAMLRTEWGAAPAVKSAMDNVVRRLNGDALRVLAGAFSALDTSASSREFIRDVANVLTAMAKAVDTLEPMHSMNGGDVKEASVETPQAAPAVVANVEPMSTGDLLGWDSVAASNHTAGTADSSTAASRELKMHYHAESLALLAREAAAVRDASAAQALLREAQARLDVLNDERARHVRVLQDCKTAMKQAREELTATRHSYDRQLRDLSDRVVDAEAQLADARARLEAAAEENRRLKKERFGFVAASS